MAAAIVASLARRSLTSTSSSCISRYVFRNDDSPFCYDDYHVQLLRFSTKSFQKSPSNTTTPLVFTQDYFVDKYQFSPQIASKIVSASARMKNPQNADLFLSFLNQTGFSNTHLERIIRYHTYLLSKSPERSVTPKLKIFQDLGLSTAEATQLIGRNPNILKYQPKRIIHSLDVYRRLLGSNDKLINLIKKFGCLLYTDPEKTILPNIEFLKSCGVQHDQITSRIYSFPFLFTQSPENLRRCVDKVDEMGVDRTSKVFIYAASAVCMMSDVSLKLKLKAFQDLGFSEDETSRVLRTTPLVIAVSTRKMKEVKEVLLETGKYNMSCILSNPTSLMISVEKTYKPRLQVLKVLEGKGLINKWPPLSTLYKMSRKKFFDKFVAPNINEVGEELIAKTAVSGKLEMAAGMKPL